MLRRREDESMRAAALLIALLFAATVAARAAVHAAGEGDPSSARNAAEQAIANAEAAAGMAMDAASNDSMDLGEGANLMDMPGNYTAPAPPPRPAWMGGGMWLIAGEERSTIFWYFEPLESDFTVTPHRVVLRADETADAASPHNNTARLAEIDCAANRYRILRTTHYDDAGNATEANERGDGSMMPVRRGTVFE
jgi:hypothetical protein